MTRISIQQDSFNSVLFEPFVFFTMRLTRKEFEETVIGNVLPDKITLFQLPIESFCRTKEEIKEKVREVVIQEMGYYFDLDEESPRYWAAQPMSSYSRRASVGIPDSSHPIIR